MYFFECKKWDSGWKFKIFPFPQTIYILFIIWSLLFWILIFNHYSKIFKLNIIISQVHTSRFTKIFTRIFTLTEIRARIDNVRAHHMLAMLASVICSTGKGKFQSDWSAYGLPRIPNTAAYCLWRNHACESEIV